VSDPTWAFVLITPDGIVTGAYDTVADSLEGAGFRIVGGRLLRMQVANVCSMYSHHDSPPVPSGSRDELPLDVLDDLYAIAPGCVIVLTSTHAHPFETLVRLKGDKRPALAEPSSIRRAGEHLVFNTLHCPDDAGAAAIELAYVAGQEPARRLTELARRADELGPVVGRGALARSLPAVSGPEAISFPLIANRVRRRILADLLLERADDPKGRAALRRAHDALDAERRELEATADSTARLALASARSSLINDLVSDPALDPAPSLGAALVAIDALLVYNTPRDIGPLLALPDEGVYVSPLETLAIRAHGHSVRADDDPVDTAVRAVRPARAAPAAG
jgi:nucleoside diphosphate kinase